MSKKAFQGGRFAQGKMLLAPPLFLLCSVRFSRPQVIWSTQNIYMGGYMKRLILSGFAAFAGSLLIFWQTLQVHAQGAPAGRPPNYPQSQGGQGAGPSPQQRISEVDRCIKGTLQGTQDFFNTVDSILGTLPRSSKACAANPGSCMTQRQREIDQLTSKVLAEFLATQVILPPSAAGKNACDDFKNEVRRVWLAELLAKLNALRTGVGLPELQDPTKSSSSQ